MPTLDLLECGQRGMIESISGDDAVCQRMMEMGVIEGEPIELIAVAPLGDPIEVRVCNYNLSLRKTEAKRIVVKLDDPVVDEQG